MKHNREGPEKLEIRCPRCAAARLQLRRSCSATTLRCRCGADLALAELVEQIDDKTFARLAELVGDTLADRL